MNKKEILKKVREIEVKSNIVANEIFSGSYHSYFKGNGMEFSEIRRYVPGDDVKKVDWKVTARQGKAYVKEFVEERELLIYLLVDISSSNLFDEKRARVAEIVGTLAFSANKNNDKVGAIFFSDKVEKIMPLKKGKKHGMAILDCLLSFDEKKKKTNINNALGVMNRILKRKAIIFIISDFYDEGYEKNYKLLSQKHDVISISLRDLTHERLPKGALYQVLDSETGEELVIDALKETVELHSSLDDKKAINLTMETDYIKSFISFFKRRRRKR